MFKEQQPGMSELYVITQSVEEPAVIFPLQFLDMLTDGGLADEELL